MRVFVYIAHMRRGVTTITTMEPVLPYLETLPALQPSINRGLNTLIHAKDNALSPPRLCEHQCLAFCSAVASFLPSLCGKALSLTLVSL